MTRPQQEQIGQHRDPHGICAPLPVSTDLMVAQSQPRFEVSIHECYGPAFLVDAHHLSRCPLRSIGHHDFCLFGAHVTPFFTQHQGDVAHMTQAQVGMIRPKRLGALARVLSGNTGALGILLRHRGDEILEPFLINGFPGTGNGKDKAPAACGIGLVPVLDHLHVGFGAIGRITTHNHQSRPTRRDERAHHLAKQRIFIAITSMTFGQNDATASPASDNRPKQRSTTRSGCRTTRGEAGFFGLAAPPDFGAAFVGLAAVAKKIEEAVAWRWQGDKKVLGHPADEQMDVPIGSFEKPSKAPGGDRRGRPSRHLLQGFASGIECLPEDEPAEHEAMGAFPYAGHALKRGSDESGQIREGDHHGQDHPRTSDMETGQQ